MITIDACPRAIINAYPRKSTLDARLIVVSRSAAASHSQVPLFSSPRRRGSIISCLGVRFPRLINPESIRRELFPPTINDTLRIGNLLLMPRKCDARHRFAIRERPDHVEELVHVRGDLFRCVRRKS